MERKPRTSRSEWVAAALSAALVFPAIGYMAYEGWTEPDTPPRIEIVVDTVLAFPDGYLVEFEAHNRGHTTAAALLVEGELRGGGEPETAEVTIDFVPAESMRRAGLFFSRDPRRHRLEIRPKGYDLP